MHTVWAKLAWLTPCEPGSATQRTKQAQLATNQTGPTKQGPARSASLVRRGGGQEFVRRLLRRQNLQMGQQLQHAVPLQKPRVGNGMMDAERD